MVLMAREVEADESFLVALPRGSNLESKFSQCREWFA